MGKSNKKLIVLTFHRVLPLADELVPTQNDARAFEMYMSVLAKYFRVFRLSDAVDMLKNGSLPSRSVCVTFDDGYKDNVTIALPILKRFGLTATFFIATGYLNGGRMWNDTVIEAVRRCDDEISISDIGISKLPVRTNDEKIVAIDRLLSKLKYLEQDTRESIANQICPGTHDLPDDLMMTSDEVVSLMRNGMDIGAHTVSHPILTKIDPKIANTEIMSSKLILEELLSEPVNLFAYPNGRPELDYRREHIEMVRNAGFKCAVSTAFGTAASGVDSYQVGRMPVWDKRPWKFVSRMIYYGANGQPAEGI